MVTQRSRHASVAGGVQMANMLDYLDWYGDFDFRAVPFNEVDNLILAQISYLDLAGVVPPMPSDGSSFVASDVPSVRAAWSGFQECHSASERVDLGPLISPLTATVFEKMAAGNRFATTRLCCYESRLDTVSHEQFGALTATLPNGMSYVSFRGTDDSLVGWREDCEMSYRVVPSQMSALSYLDEVAGLVRGELHVGGHSKGGNLAVYASAYCSAETRRRIAVVWCNDAPGFVDEVVPLSSLDPILDRVRLFTPEYSLVGSLFTHALAPTVIKSGGDTGTQGVMQHSALEWQVMRGEFVRGKGISKDSRKMGEVFSQLLASHDAAGRKRLVTNLYDALDEAGIDSLTTLASRGAVGLGAVLNSVGALDEEDRKPMTDFLLGIVGQSVVSTVSPIAKTITAAFEDARRSAESIIEHRVGTGGEI